jgi:hypothetical protein
MIFENGDGLFGQGHAPTRIKEDADAARLH